MEKEQATSSSYFERFETFLYSRKFIFLVVIAGTIPMIMHSHELFYQISPFEGNDLVKRIYSIFYAISFDLTILVFTIHYIKKKPQLYACFAFIINLLYFNPFGFIPSQYIVGFTKVFLAGVLAFTGYSYAELFVEKVAENKKSTKKRTVYKAVNIQAVPERKQEKELVGEFQCGSCEKSFKSIKALNGHMKVH
ncbi:hypothetical protein GCM10011506_30170 [Marivirga lumbricoides]|uniref:C2H2-type domain-containing protein n=1 Tax=Marivirga lumbricoides TaxID=1046115 RepID=A0ABQ1MLF0_9BACT|nr:hypothetical protein GCM10011506_30170 [Marivirga lumbricoides]